MLGMDAVTEKGEEYRQQNIKMQRMEALTEHKKKNIKKSLENLIQRMEAITETGRRGTIKKTKDKSVKKKKNLTRLTPPPDFLLPLLLLHLLLISPPPCREGDEREP